MRAGIYVHIPFCVRKCRYCSFNSIPYEEELAARYVKALLLEIEACETDFTPTSLYIGGGTPSVLPSGSLMALLDLLYSRFSGLAGCESTMEANPGALMGLDVKGLAARGVNRVSLGAQSFRPSELAMLGRLHGPEDVPAEDVERAVVLSKHGVITAADLPLHLRTASNEGKLPSTKPAGSLRETLDTVERGLILDALKEAGGVQTRAAEMLGISERVLRYKLKKYIID